MRYWIAILLAVTICIGGCQQPAPAPTPEPVPVPAPGPVPEPEPEDFDKKEVTPKPSRMPPPVRYDEK